MKIIGSWLGELGSLERFVMGVIFRIKFGVWFLLEVTMRFGKEGSMLTSLDFFWR
jgi:hypothetical protein